PGPPAERVDHLDGRVNVLQPSELAEAAAQRTRVPGAPDSVHTGRRVVEPVVVRVRVGERALAVGDVAEGVVDVGELGGRAAGDDVLHVVVAGVDAPLGEVAEDLVPAAASAGLRGAGDLAAGG